MTIHKRSVKLAGLYLIIIMVISLFFSIGLYQLSLQELSRGLRRPGPALERPSSSITRNILDQIADEREALYQEAADRVLQRLIIINLFILIGGGFLSYYLAARTLRPIEQANEALERFTADASHELRTPLTAMRTENEVALLNPKLTTQQAKDVLTSNIEELDKLGELSNNLLLLAQLDKQQLIKKPMSIDSLVGACVSQLSPLAKKRQVTIVREISKKANVNGDKALLKESLVILLDNAVKYSPPKSTVHISAKIGKQVSISVADQGIGIKKSELPHIFERFYRADSSRTKQQTNGYGLGLAIAQDIAHLHGGEIKVTSAPGRGSTFSLRLPKA